MYRTLRAAVVYTLIASTSLVAAGCDDEEESPGAVDGGDAASAVVPDGGTAASDAAATELGDGPSDGLAGEVAEVAPGEPSLYALGSLVFGDTSTSVYVALLDSLGEQKVDFKQALEFPNADDIWVHDGLLYLARSEDVTITKFAVVGRQLMQKAKISFAQLGLKSVGFWNNVFVSPTKAYMLNESAEYVVWNPATMEITGTIPLPKLEVPAGFKSYPAYLDRAQVLRDGLLFQSIYLTDESYFQYVPKSYVVVVDTTQDKVVQTLEAPCPGLDFATKDDAGNFYFSSWVYAPGGAAVLNQPPTCVVKLAAGTTTLSKAFEFPALTGHQGAALTHIAGGYGIMSVLHEDHATGDKMDVKNVTFAQNWRFWSYDFASNQASLIDAVGWHGGAQYTVRVDGQALMLVSTGDYSSSTIYRHASAANQAPTRLFDTTGWAVRLFKVR